MRHDYYWKLKPCTLSCGQFTNSEFFSNGISWVRLTECLYSSLFFSAFTTLVTFMLVIFLVFIRPGISGDMILKSTDNHWTWIFFETNIIICIQLSIYLLTVCASSTDRGAMLCCNIHESQERSAKHYFPVLYRPIWILFFVLVLLFLVY